MNKVILIGRVGKDPEVKEAAGSKVARLSLATTDYFKNSAGEKKEITDWHSIVCWKGLAEICEKYVAKGQLVAIEGKLKQRSYEGKEGGKRFVTEVLADSIQMLSKVEKPEKQEKSDQPFPVMPEIPTEEVNDLPF